MRNDYRAPSPQLAGRGPGHSSRRQGPSAQLQHDQSPGGPPTARAVICKRWVTYSTAPGTAKSRHPLTQVWVLPDSGRFTMSNAQGLYLTCLTQSGHI